MSDAVNEVPPLRKGMSVWRVVGILVISLLVAFLLVYLWISVVGQRRFREMGADVDQMLAEARARDASRPVLHGTAVAGNSWTDYEPALKETRSMRADREALGLFIERKPKADRARVEGILAAHPSPIEQLRKGAVRATGQYPYRWEDGFVAGGPGFIDAQVLAQLAVIRSRLLVEEGKLREAVELLLDCCQFARDLGHNATLISGMLSMAHYGLAFDELRGILETAAPAKEDLLDLERALEAVDRSFPSMEFDYFNEAMATGCALRKEDLQGIEGMVLLRGFEGPRRLLFADAFDTHRHFMRLSGATESKPWSEALRLQAEMDRELEKLWNPLSRLLTPGLIGSGRAARERRAQLRLLRVAAHYRATGELLSLDDPLGVRLNSTLTGTRLKIWSVGRDGADDGGTGDWKPTTVKSDIVLEVDR